MESLNGFVVFVQVAEMRSFVAAGRNLGVSASAVGKSIARLEDKLGVRLFHRSTRSITLTAEGHLLLERSRRILAEIEAAQQELTQRRSTRSDVCDSACRWWARWYYPYWVILCASTRRSSWIWNLPTAWLM